MSENEDELNENELNALLADLETRAGGGGGSASASSTDDDDEDLEAFLSRLESEDSSASSPAKKQVATDERDDDLAAQFAELDNLQPDDLPAKPAETAPAESKEAKKAKKAKKKKGKKGKESTEVAKKDGEAANEAPSKGAVVAKVAAKWLVLALPVVAFTWMLGAFLAQWVSAGWLILGVALLVALGVPALVNHFVKKGKFSWWAAGIGLALTVALTAPMPQQAGEALSRYGHWPASTVADVAGWDVSESTLVGINAGMAELVGGLLHPGQAPVASELGTDHPIDPDDAPAEP